MSPPSQSPLLDLIRSRIAQHGPMGLDEYMALCLGHPQHGYYMTRDPFGAGGDFTTAPEISQLFGEMIGVWLADLWIKFGKPSDFILLEVGPGRGTLMADIMRATKRVPGFHDAAKIHLMEISPVLRNAQSKVLVNYETRWIDGLEALNSAIPVFVIGNEFLDALPVRHFVRKGETWAERVVGLGEGNTLQFGLKDADYVGLESLGDRQLKVKDEEILELSPAVSGFIKTVNELLIKQSGAALFLDYGYAKTAAGETLQAVRSHRFENVLEHPGESDLTAHVDFENVGRLAKQDGVFIHGPIEQGIFLKNLGIEFRAQKLIDGLQLNSSSVCGVDEPQIEMIKSGLHRLIDTDQMGSLFKAIALCHDPEIIPAGFHEGL